MGAMVLVWQMVVAGLAAMLIGISKTGISGLGILSVVLLASIFPARDSVGIVLPVLIVGDIVAVASYRREASWSHLWRIFPWAALGVIIGALALGKLDNLLMQRLIGGLVVVLVIMQFIRMQQSHSKPDGESQISHTLGIGAGLLAGFTTMIANAAGPIMAIYLLAMRLPKMIYMGTSAWYFLVLNVFKVPFSVGLGVINTSTLMVSMALAPFTILGAIIGRWLLVRIDQRLFENLAIGLSLVAGLRLIFL